MTNVTRIHDRVTAYMVRPYRNGWEVVEIRQSGKVEPWLWGKDTRKEYASLEAVNSFMSQLAA